MMYSREAMPDGKPSATLKEIAERLGLNVGTVSRALNGSPRVREETRRQVEKAAAELEYRPNRSARNLVRRKPASRFIAILMPNVVHPFYLTVLKGIINELDAAAFHAMIFNLRGSRENVIHRILDEAPDGLLVFAREMAEEERAAMTERRIRHLYVDCLSERDPCVYFDNYLGGQLAARYLLGRGVRSPLYVGLTAPSQQQELRFRGFTDALAENGIHSIEARYILRDERLAAEIAREVLASGRHDGIFFYCDELAYGGLRAEKEAGIRVPILGYDDLHISDLLGLTTIRQDGEEMGRIGARQIVDIVGKAEWSGEAPPTDRRPPCPHIRLEPVLIERT